MFILVKRQCAPQNCLLSPNVKQQYMNKNKAKNLNFLPQTIFKYLHFKYKLRILVGYKDQGTLRYQRNLV